MDLQTIPVQLVDAVLRECHVRFSVSSLSSSCKLNLFRVGRKVEGDGLFHIRDFALEVIHDPLVTLDSMGLLQFVEGPALILVSVAVRKLEGETSAPDALHLGQLLFHSLVLLVRRSIERGEEQYGHDNCHNSCPHEMSSNVPDDTAARPRRPKNMVR